MQNMDNLPLGLMIGDAGDADGAEDPVPPFRHLRERGLLFPVSDRSLFPDTR